MANKVIIRLASAPWWCAPDDRDWSFDDFVSPPRRIGDDGYIVVSRRRVFVRMLKSHKDMIKRVRWYVAIKSRLKIKPAWTIDR